MSEVKTTVVTFEEFSDYNFIPPATFYVMGFNSEGNQAYYFIHTSKRAVAQQWADEKFGKGRYSVKTSKIQKGSGNITCSGTQTTKGQR